MQCTLVDVFANKALTGNGLTIFSDCESLSSQRMLALTREMRQYESIFLFESAQGLSARIFTMDEELDFAGHPLLGLAHFLGERSGVSGEHSSVSSEQHWQVALNTRKVELRSWTQQEGSFAAMDQGKPSFGHILDSALAQWACEAIGLSREDLAHAPAQIVSTGLPYLILPLRTGLEKVSYREDISYWLSEIGAKFLYALDVERLEGRSFDNAGKSEDIATGSAAGPAAAYLWQHQLVARPQLSIQQGRFVHRPSEIKVSLDCEGRDINNVAISGQVITTANISFV
ncbi:PhzF family phenazine biosynthesis protein [Aliagarivorans marinus]|uniref:PhzF family phenazine biosynthesis protein n=1 Tax=Aliagarivorans marinus TaxID=561965 RepID=UPI00041C124C|nr:PhzF family phenazine biosynthesis protein [Aliagarivorans marinus]